MLIFQSFTSDCNPATRSRGLSRQVKRSWPTQLLGKTCLPMIYGFLALYFSAVCYAVPRQPSQQSQLSQLSQSAEDANLLRQDTDETGGQSVTPDQAAAEKVVAMISVLAPYRAEETLEGELRVFGTPTMDAICSRWGEGLNRVHPNLKIELSSVKGKKILQELVNHPRGVAMFAHPLKAEEIELLRQQGLKSPQQFEVGVQALGVFVHDSNPMTTISQQQFLKIFSSAEMNESGELVIPQISGEQETCDWTQVTWGDLGIFGEWQNKKIHLACRDEVSGTQIFLRERLLGGIPIRQPKTRLNSSAEVLAMIADDPQAVGLSNLRSRQVGARALQLFDGDQVIPCHDYSILVGQYPLVRKVTLVIDDDPENSQTLPAREFVKFALSQQGQRETILAGFFPVEPEITKAQLHRLERK